MDGRYEECYYDREFDNFVEFISAGENWYRVLTNYPTKILMPDKKTPIYV